MDTKSSLELKKDIVILRNKLDNLLKSGEVDVSLTLELSRELDIVINDFNKSSDIN